MPTLQEGNLTFDFPGDETAVAKYDDLSFYRRQFQQVCGRATAVDFVFIEGNRTWLIEVKDYRQQPRKKPSDIADEVAEKVRDTLAGLAACRCNADDDEERRVAHRALSTERLGVVLHLEQPATDSKLFPRVADPASLQQKLKQLLGPVDPNPAVVDRNTVTAPLNWQVT